MNPGYILTQGEYDILMAVTQLCPRILEQSILHHFPCSLNGIDRLVRFRYVRFNPATLTVRLVLGKTAIPINVISGNKVIATSSSKEQLLRLLGILSRRTIARYMNHVVPLNTPPALLGGPVNLREVHFRGPLHTNPIIHRADNELLLPDLVIPDINSPYDLLKGPVYVYDITKKLFGIFPSIVVAARALNPNSSNTRGREIKISRLMGLEGLVVNELGSFYFNEHPEVDRYNDSSKGRLPCILYDLELNTSTAYDGLKPLVRDLS